MKLQYHILFLVFLLSAFCFGQTQTYYVKPVDTDLGYNASEDSSAISINTGFQVNKLFLFIGGTNSSSSTDYNALRLHAANLGYDFINLSYPNTVAAASLANNTDSLAFDKYRQEVCFGTPESGAVTVDTLNSIYTRTLKLIQYLDLTYPSQNWGQYLATSSTLEWSKIAVGGHSQGSGHAAYLAKQFDVERVLMFSGPNDYSNSFSRSAHWLRQAGITPVGEHFVYLSLNDEVVDFSKQFTDITGLGMLTNDDTTHVDLTSSPYGNSHCLYTTQSPGIVILNHNVPIKLTSINNDVWTYMLTTPITTGIEENDPKSRIKVYPNPTSDIVHIAGFSEDNIETYSIYKLSGELIRTEPLKAQQNTLQLDLHDLPSGVYLLKVKSRVVKIMKK